MFELASAMFSIADANEFRFARFYIVCEVVAQGARTKVLKLSVGLRTQSVECSKLGKTRIIADAVTGWLEIPHFLNRMFRRYSNRNRSGILLIISLIAESQRFL